MPTKTALPPLRALLLIDAATCASLGLALALGARPVAALTGLPATLLLYGGLVLLPIAAFLALVALRPALQPAGGWLAVAGNAAWIAASFALLAFGWVAPNGLGVACVLVQALAAAGLTMLEFVALRRIAPHPQAA